jgi:vitamin B12 transporter
MVCLRGVLRMTRTFSFACSILVTVFMVTAVIAQESGEKDTQVDEQVVVYGSKSDRDQASMESRTIVVTAQEIEAYQWQTVADVLTSMPGLSVVAQGGSGTLTRVFARGAASENTLVLLDGVRLNDTSGTGRGFDFAHLETSGIERIEIILGPQTTLYGTDASSGVVNIVSNQSLETLVRAESTGDDMYRASAESRIMLGAWKVGVQGSRVDDEDISARISTRFDEQETDRYTNTTLRATVSRDWGNDGLLNFAFTSIEGEGDIDSFDGDDLNHISDYQQNAFAANYRRSFMEGKWISGLYAGYQETDRQVVDGPDADRDFDGGSISEFNGEFWSIEWRNNLTLGKHGHLLAGAAYEQEEADGLFVSGPREAPSFSDPFNASEASTSSLFAQLEMRDYQGFNASVGGRFDDHDTFGSETTYRSAVSYTIPNTQTRLRSSFGTGFKAPSLYQLYSTFGNLDLLEETSETFEAGIEGVLSNGFLTWGATYFENSYENQIDFFFDPVTFASFYDNLDQVETDGWEVYLSLNAKAWSLYAGYDKLNAEDRTNPELAVPLLRRYDDKINLRLSANPLRKLQVFSEATYHGDSIDSSFSAGTQTLDSYTLVDLGLRYTLTDEWQLTARGENIFDENYVRVIDYEVPGERYYLGVRFKQPTR